MKGIASLIPRLPPAFSNCMKPGDEARSTRYLLCPWSAQAFKDLDALIEKVGRVFMKGTQSLCH